MSALLSNKTDKYEYLTVAEVLPSNQKQITEHDKFTYSCFGKALKQQTKTLKEKEKNKLML